MKRYGLLSAVLALWVSGSAMLLLMGQEFVTPPVSSADGTARCFHVPSFKKSISWKDDSLPERGAS